LIAASAARKPEVAKVRDAFERFLPAQQKFAAPDGAVGPYPVPSTPRQRGKFDFIFRHAGENVRPVVLDGVQRDVDPRGQLRGVPGRGIIGVQIARDDFGCRLMEPGRSAATARKAAWASLVSSRRCAG